MTIGPTSGIGLPNSAIPTRAVESPRLRSLATEVAAQRLLEQFFGAAPGQGKTARPTHSRPATEDSAPHLGRHLDVIA